MTSPPKVCGAVLLYDAHVTVAIRVLVCDDHLIVREGLSRLLDGSDGITVVGMAADGEEGVAEAVRLRPDVVLMDLLMPRVDGVEATRRIVDAVPGATVLVLTSFADRERVVGAIDAGAAGYVLKDAEPADLIRAVHSAAKGYAPLDPRAARTLLDTRSPSAPGATLSPREREVLQLLARGLANKVIAIRLGITEGTVKAHLTAIYKQIGVSDRTQAAIWARDNGLA